MEESRSADPASGGKMVQRKIMQAGITEEDETEGRVMSGSRS